MSKHKVAIKKKEKVTHDVLRFVVERPVDYDFEPGQATEVSINKEGWKEEGRPFTFTSLPEDEDIEFTIKIYPDHEGVTNELQGLEEGDELLLGDVFGAISYEGEGVFIAGGAGVTPFISILRMLDKNGDLGNSKLIFANKTRKDIIHKDEFKDMLGLNFTNILSEEDHDDHDYGHIDKRYLMHKLKDFSCKFYICGPPSMVEVVPKYLKKLEVPEENIVTEDL